MSIPKNHHYVSQCQQKEFFNYKDGKIYLYDKNLDNFYPSTSTKNLFSSDYINSKEICGEINHEYLEAELKFLIEDDYPKNISIIKQFVKDKIMIYETQEALYWLAVVGLLNEIRHPSYKKTLEEGIYELKSKTLSHLTGFSPDQIKPIIKYWKKTKFQNVLNYSDTVIRNLSRMEPLNFEVFVIESSDHFILPDTSGVLVRGQLQRYLNPLINEIVAIGVPITDKIFILCSSKRLGDVPNGILKIPDDDSEIVYNINREIFKFSYKAIACSNSNFLEKFINKIKIENNYAVT